MLLFGQGTPDKPDIRVCRLPDIKRSIPTHAMRPTTDQGSNQVAINDQVSVADGPLKGRVGIVKYIHRGMLFIQVRPPGRQQAYPELCLPHSASDLDPPLPLSLLPNQPCEDSRCD